MSIIARLKSLVTGSKIEPPVRQKSQSQPKYLNKRRNERIPSKEDFLKFKLLFKELYGLPNGKKVTELTPEIRKKKEEEFNELQRKIFLYTNGEANLMRNERKSVQNFRDDFIRYLQLRYGSSNDPYQFKQLSTLAENNQRIMETLTNKKLPKLKIPKYQVNESVGNVQFEPTSLNKEKVLNGKRGNKITRNRNTIITYSNTIIKELLKVLDILEQHRLGINQGLITKKNLKTLNLLVDDYGSMQESLKLLRGMLDKTAIPKQIKRQTERGHIDEIIALLHSLNRSSKNNVSSNLSKINQLQANKISTERKAYLISLIRQNAPNQSNLLNITATNNGKNVLLNRIYKSLHQTLTTFYGYFGFYTTQSNLNKNNSTILGTRRGEESNRNISITGINGTFYLFRDFPRKDPVKENPIFSKSSIGSMYTFRIHIDEFQYYFTLYDRLCLELGKQNKFKIDNYMVTNYLLSINLSVKNSDQLIDLIEIEYNPSLIRLKGDFYKTTYRYKDGLKANLVRISKNEYNALPSSID